jgi:hypothetical protein
MRYLYLTVVIFLLVACGARIPDPIGYPYSQQQKMQASGHWEVLAKDLANRINNELIKSDNINKAIFVEETCGDEGQVCDPLQTSAFNEAFRDLLITSLVGFGIPTKNKPDEESIKILYKVQVVHHNTKRFRSLQPGLLTALSSAIVVLRNAPTNLVILATGVAIDVANSNLVISEQNEIIITTSMITDSKYLFRASDIYYINDKDFWHYQERPPQVTTIRLSTPVKNAFEKNMPSPSVNEVKPSGEQTL